MQSEFDLKVSRQDRAAVLALSGELDSRSVRRLEDDLEPVWRSDVELVILDFRGLVFMDSAGLRAVVLAHGRAQKEHRRLAVVDGGDQVHWRLRRTGVLAVLTVIASPEELLG